MFFDIIVVCKTQLGDHLGRNIDVSTPRRKFCNESFCLASLKGQHLLVGKATRVNMVTRPLGASVSASVKWGVRHEPYRMFNPVICASLSVHRGPINVITFSLETLHVTLSGKTAQFGASGPYFPMPGHLPMPHPEVLRLVQCPARGRLAPPPTPRAPLDMGAR